MDLAYLDSLLGRYGVGLIAVYVGSVALQLLKMDWLDLLPLFCSAGHFDWRWTSLVPFWSIMKHPPATGDKESKVIQGILHCPMSSMEYMHNPIKP